MTLRASHTAFDLFHPVVALIYFVSMLAIGMAAMQPVYLIISFCAAFAYGIVVRGARAMVRTLAWQVPLAVAVTAANVIMSASGSTELFRIGSRAFYAEGLAFGACMALMLATALIVLENASRVLTSDKVMALFGGVAPTIGLMLAMALRLVPRFVCRGNDVSDVQRACTAARSGNCDVSGLSCRLSMHDNLRLVSTLMGWSMEDSLEASDSMLARGWKAGFKRTTYRRVRFRLLDAAACAVVGVLALVSAASAYTACSQFNFYPFIRGFAPWWSYVCYVVLAALPLIAQVRERMLWR